MAEGMVGGAALGNAIGKISIDASSLNTVTAVASGVAAQTKRELATIDAAVKTTEATFTRFAKIKPMATSGTARTIPGAAELTAIGGNIERALAGMEAAVGRFEARLDQMAEAAKPALDKVAEKVEKVESRLSRASRGIGAFRQELGALSIGSGLLVGAGLRVASTYETAAIKLSGMAGGIENAQKLSEQLRKQAAAAGIPFQDMLNVATRLLPSLEGNTKELEKWYDVVKRTAVLNAQEGVTGAAFSINEAMTSGGTDLVSLVERFNISRVKMRAALAANNNDFRLALDQVLNGMGITTQVAERMGQSFNSSFLVAKDAAMQLLAEGFTPLLQALTPLLQASAAYLATVRETNPEIVQLGAGLATVAAVGAPTLLLFNQLYEAGQKLKALGILGTLGRGGMIAGTVAAVGAAGIGANTLVNRGIGRVTGNEAQANMTFSDSFAAFRNGVAVIINAMIDAGLYVNHALMKVAQAILATVATVYETIGGMLRYVGGMLPGGAMGLGSGLTTTGDKLINRAATKRETNASIDSINERMWRGGEIMKDNVRRFVTGKGDTEEPAAQAAAAAVAAEKAAADAQRDIKVKWAQASAAIERNAADERLAATRQYEQQRTQTIAQYEQGIARDAEDFARARARAAAQLAKQIADIEADAAKRDARWQRDYNESIADIRSDGNERIQELEERYNDDREKAARDHRDRLLSAAARLDAVGVFEEKRRYARQQEDAAEAFDERKSTEAENLAERLQQEKEAHQERLADARAADAERIQDMRDALAESQALEDEDRAIRQERQAADFQAQLSQMAQAQAERMDQITAQAAREKAQLDEQFLAELSAAGIHNEQWLALQKAKEDASLQSFDKWWQEINKKFAVQGPENRIIGPQQSQNGWITDFLGGRNNVTPQAQFPTSFTGGSSRSVNVSQGAIVVYGAPGQSETAIGEEVRRQLEMILEEAL